VRVRAYRQIAQLLPIQLGHFLGEQGSERVGRGAEGRYEQTEVSARLQRKRVGLTSALIVSSSNERRMDDPVWTGMI
jgi:hypothetical protein